MPEITAQTQMSKIRSYEKGFMAVQMMTLGAKLGLFEALHGAEGGLTVPELAAILELHEPYLKHIVQTAYHFELVDRVEGGRFVLQPFLGEILADRKSFRNYLPNLRMDVDYVGVKMIDVPEYFRSGEVARALDTAEAARMAYATTRNIHLVLQFMVFPKHEPLKQVLERGGRCLDVGCGDGTLITCLAQAFPKATFVGVNPDRFGVETAQAAIGRFGLGDRVSVRQIGGQELEETAVFDLASLVVTLHEIPPAVRPQVIRQVHRALKPGGRLLVLDLPFPETIEDFRNPVYDYGIMDQFYEICIGTVHYTRDEQDALLTGAGFRDIRHESIGKGMFELITAAK